MNLLDSYIYGLCCCSFINICANAGSIILPDGSDVESDLVKLRNDYIPPLIKFNGTGLFECDNRLIYSIDEAILETYKIKKSLSPLEYMYILSEDHWIALNKKEHEYAKKIAVEMMEILCGKYQLCKFTFLNQNLYMGFVSDKFRWIEQIQLSLGNIQSNVFESTPQSNIDSDLVSLADLAKYLTLTPMLFQMQSYEMLKIMERNGVNTPKYKQFIRDLKPKLKARSQIGHIMLSNIFRKYSDKEISINLAFESRRKTYAAYLNCVLDLLKKMDIKNYKTADRGQTSGTHRKTCMFNASFYIEVSRGMIHATKSGCLDKAQEYIGKFTNTINQIIKYSEYESLLGFSGITHYIAMLRSNSGADAMYAYNGEILPCDSASDKRIFPGIFSDASVIEAGKIMCMSNLVMFSKSQTFCEYGETLAGYYGCGFFCNEYFPITAISYSTSHAQSLLKK